MPHYNFLDKTTQEEFTLSLSMAEREEFLAANPHVIQTLTSVNIGDSVSLGVTKPPSDFSKYVLGKVAQAPGANKDTIEKRRSIVREF